MSEENNGCNGALICGLFFLIIILTNYVGWKVVLVLVGIGVVGWLLNQFDDRCPHCGKFGGMETVDEETISESSPYNRFKDGEMKVFVKVRKRIFKRCSACGHETEKIDEYEREI